jgi:hypothetical protein
MRPMELLRYVVIGVAAIAVLFGILVMAGVFVPIHFPEQYRIPIGAIIALYGAYHGVTAFSRKQRN